MKFFILGLAAVLCLVGCGRTSSEDIKAIQNNLQQLYYAAAQHALETGKQEARYDDLVGTGAAKYIRQIKSIRGEDYRALVIKVDALFVSVKTRDGTEVVYRVPR